MIVIEDKDLIDKRRGKKIIKRLKSVASKPIPTVEIDKNEKAMLELAAAIRALSEKPNTDITPLADGMTEAIRAVLESQQALKSALKNQAIKLKTWEFSVTRDVHGRIKTMKAREVTNQ